MSDQIEGEKFSAKEAEIAQCILVDVDALFDTRLATAMIMNEDYPPKLLENGYWTRNHDFYSRLIEGFDDKEFKTRYENRDWMALANSRMTNLTFLLNALTRRMERRILDTPYNFPVILYINIHPYELTPIEIERLAIGIKDKLAVSTSLRVINMSNDNVTPQWVNDHVAMMIKYDGDKWLEMHGQALMKAPMPQTTLMLPALIRDETAMTSMAKGLDGNEYDLFEEIPKGAAILIDLHYTSAGEMSVINPRIANELKKSKKRKEGI